MAAVVVRSEFGVSADALWKLVGDFGNVSWMQGISQHEIEGQGPGMVRVFHVGDAPPVREQLEAVDEQSRTLTYTIPEGIPFPVLNYRAKMVVSETAAGSLLEWSCSCDPDGVSDKEASAIIEGMYGAMVGWLKSALGSD